MWVVKLGGSMNSNPVLPDWLDVLVQCGGGRVATVCGGGSFADEVRRAQAHWQFDDLDAHNMAVLAMAQTAYLLHGLNPGLQLVRNRADLKRVLHQGKTALWLPFDAQREQAEAHTNWDNSSDSIALELARTLNAERFVLVKSCPIDPRADLAELTRSGVVDGRFAALADGAAFPIMLIHHAELDRMRAMLLGE